jgi:hypothetical protein
MGSEIKPEALKAFEGWTEPSGASAASSFDFIISALEWLMRSEFLRP